MSLLKTFAGHARFREWIVKLAFNIPFGSDFLCRQAFKHVNPQWTGKKSKDVIRVLLSMEADDRYVPLQEVNSYCGKKIEYFSMPNRIFDELYKYRMERYRIEECIDNANLYRTQGVEYQKSLAALYGDLSSVLRWIKRVVDPDIFISASIGDARWKHVCKIAKEEIGVPWLVTEREGVISKLSYTEGPARVAHSFSPRVDFMTTCNLTHALRWRKSGIPPEHIAIVGELKSDLWFTGTKSYSPEVAEVLDGSKRRLLYFAFGDRNYLNSSELPPDQFNWRELRLEHFSALKNLLSRRDDVQVIIKGGHKGDIAAVLKEYFSNELSRRKVVVIENEFNAIDLIKSCDIVMGLQSTVMVEAHFTDKPIIYCGWGEMHDSVYDQFLLPIREGDVLRCANTKELGMRIEQCLEGNYEVNKEHRKRFRESFFAAADGRVRLRLLDAVISIVENGRLPSMYLMPKVGQDGKVLDLDQAV